MKCKGIIKDKKNTSNKKPKICNAVIDDHAIFCPYCGTPTQALKNELSAQKVFREGIKDFRSTSLKFTVTGIFLMIITLITLYLVFFVTAKLYYVNNLVILFLVPFLLIPFGFNWKSDNMRLSFRNYLAGLKNYPRLWLFILMNLIYYFLLKVICTGFLLSVATDPILHLVRLILAIYWLAVVFAVPYLILKKKIPLYKALKISYQAGSETRWQHFFLLIFIAILNLIAIIPLGLGLIFTLPVSYKIIDQYYRNLDEFQLFTSERKKNV
jgi:hypothetical protein